MRVLVLAPARAPIIKRMVGELERRGYEVLCASHNVEDMEGVYHLGRLRGFHSYLNFLKVQRLIKAFDPDVVHAHVANHYGLMSLFSTRPVVLALWGSDILLAPSVGLKFKKLIHRWFNRLALAKAAVVHSSGQHVIDSAISQYPPVEKKALCFYWGFPVQPENGSDELRTLKSLNLPSESPGFLVFPRGLTSIYNPEACADVINALIDNGYGKRVVVLRAFSSDENLNAFRKKVNLESINYIDKMLSSTELYYLYKNSSVHFSLASSDALGGGVIEPALLGSIPVLSKIDAYKIFDCVDASFTFENYTFKELSRFLEFVKDVDDKKIPLESLCSLVSQYDKSNIVERIIGIYELSLNLITNNNNKA